jgi:microsomal dipeptidase-like Zn-dependent dipeptidase
MIVDLHSHYPMHLMSDQPDAASLMVDVHRETLGDRFRASVLRLFSEVGNYQGKRDTPSVTIPNLAISNVRVALSVLYAPFDEIDLGVAYAAGPQPGYFDDLLAQIKRVEAEVALQGSDAAVVHDHNELEATLKGGKVALIHAIEGGFYIGSDAEVISENVSRLADAGVAYITVAHLFFRQVATNAPAIPFLADPVYRALFPQPRKGLTEIGKAVITAMTKHHILIDISHMSAESIDDTIALLDELDPTNEIPLFASHSACQAFSGAEYNLSDDHIRAIARRRGVVGLIACDHWMTRGLPDAKTPADTVATIFRHIDHIHEVADGGSGEYKHVAFGSDQDGFIKPALSGLETPNGFRKIEDAIKDKYPDSAEDICSGNAMRLLRYWKP